jgi:hypothetical protein
LSFSKNPVLKFCRKNAQKRCVPENSREKKLCPSPHHLHPPHAATHAAAVTESGQGGAVAPAAGWQTSGYTQKQRENAKNRAPRLRPVFLTQFNALKLGRISM